MYTLNQLTIIGFTGHEADVHYTANGTLSHAIGCDKAIVETR